MARWLAWACIAVTGVCEGAIPFVHLDVEDGLSHNSVYAIAQDRDGFLWFGTADGLNRFDGYEFRIYRQGGETPGTLSNNSVSVLLLDNQGRLWVGTEEGINRYLPKKDAFRRYDTAEAYGRPGLGRITALHQDSRGSIWAGTEAGVLIYDAEADRFRAPPPRPGRGANPLGYVTGIQEAPDHSLWILASTVSGHFVLERRPPGREVQRHEIGSAWDVSSAFLIDRSGGLWSRHSDHGLFRDGRLLPPGPGTGEDLTAATEMRDGTIWFGTPNGLYLREPGSGAVRHEYVDSNDHSWLRNYVRAIYEDAAGSIWIGTYTGIYRYDPGARPFRSLQHDPNDPRTLSGSAVSAVTGDGETLWVGTFGGGLTAIDRESGEIDHFRYDPRDNATLPSDVIWHLLLEEESLWIGTDEGLARLDRGTGDITRTPVLSGPGTRRVGYILRGLDGTMWLGTGIGLHRYDPETGEVTRYPVTDIRTGSSQGTSDAGISVLWQQDRDTLWIGTDIGHLNRLDIPSESFRHYELSGGDERFIGEGVWDLLPGRADSLWVAHGGGLFRFETQSGEGINFGISDGLPGSIVYSVSSDDSGRLWLGTNRGLAHLEPSRGRIRNYTTRDGLPNMEFNRHADWQSPSGELYFGGIDGLTWFRPSEVGMNRTPPPVVLTELIRFGSDSIQTVHPNGLEQFAIGPHDYGFSARFAALNFVNSEQNRYLYRLVGLEDRWIVADDSRTARYTNLAPGSYTFEVRGANNDGVWSREPRRLQIAVVPAFWETGWFFWGIVGLSTTVLYALYRYRMSQIRQLEQVRLRIASDLHDDVSADLSGIAVAADMIAAREGLSGKDRGLLAEVAVTARQTGSALRDVVWYINPERDTLEALADRLRSTCNSLLANHDKQFKVAIDHPDRRLNMEFRRNVLLIYKETLHNIVRHSRAEYVDIQVHGTDDLLVIEVSDDGIGFDPVGVTAGLGTRTMHARAANIGAELSIASNPRRGTSVKLSVRITDSRDGPSRKAGIGWFS